MTTRISLDLTISFDADAWEHTHGGEWPLTQANALAYVMQMLEADAKGTGITAVEHLEATCPGCGDAIDEAEGAEPHAC